MVDIDYFFFYGKTSLGEEIDADLRQGLMQPKRSMFYHRSFGAGITEYENTPQGFALQVSMKYDIATWISKRNLEVTDGSDGTRDRRAVTSQSAITIDQGTDGVDVQVLYIPYYNYQKPATISLPVAG